MCTICLTYSNCSICHIGKNIIVTSDRGIGKTLETNGFQVLVADGKITLKGAGNGLFGGCCGYIGKNTIAFCGDLEKYSSGNDIISLCNANQVDIILLCEQELTDIGSIIPIY